MTPASLRTELTRLVTYLLRNELAIDGSTPILRKHNQTSIVTTAPPRCPGLGRPKGSRWREYVEALEQRDYLALLNDGSLLQMSFTFERSRLTRHRLAYVPCPVASDPGELSSMLSDDALRVTLAASLEFPLDRGGPRVAGSAPIRFDFIDPPASEHPCVHCHMGMSSSRVPVFGPLSPGHFIRFVFQQFYPALCDGHEQLFQWPLEFQNRRLTEEDQLGVHFDCREAV